VEAGIASESEDAPPPAPRWALDAALGDGQAYPLEERGRAPSAGGGRALSAAAEDDLDGRLRRRLKPYQRVERRLRAGDADALEAFFGVTPAPNVAQRNGIAAAMGLTLEQVTTWFKRRQAQPASMTPLSVARRASVAASAELGEHTTALQRALSLASAGGGGMERLASRFDSSAAADVAARMLSGGRFASTT
jgi:hypothetical protein